MKRIFLIALLAAMTTAIALLSEAVIQLSEQVEKQRSYIEGGCR